MTIPTLIFFFAASALGLASFFYFAFSKNVRRKSVWWPLAHLAALVLFVAWQVYRSPGWGVGVALSAAVALAAWASLRTSFFCPRCAMLIYSGGPFEVRKKCPSCGYEFGAGEGIESAAVGGEAGEGAGKAE